MSASSVSAAALGAGSVIAGRYRLLDPLGRGGMGTVWRADHLVLGSTVAVKLLQAAAGDERAERRFSTEAQAAARLRSPHVVQVLDHGIEIAGTPPAESQRVPYIVMELLEGESLGARLATRGALDLAETERIVTQVARALGRAHAAGIVHRDLKPDNVFIVRNDDDEVVKVLDFGIAKVKRWAESPVKAESHTEDGAVVGTPSYMSPEQIQGDPVDARADLWALGILAFQCLSGRLPFAGKTVGDLLTKVCTTPAPSLSRFVEVPLAVDAWMERALERRPDDRFASAREMSDALRSAMGLPPLDRGSAPESSTRRETATVDAAMHATTAEAPLGEPTAGDGASLGVIHSPVTPKPRRTLAIAAGVVALAGAIVFATTSTGTPEAPPSKSAEGPAPPTVVAAAPPPPIASSSAPASPADPVPSASVPSASIEVAPPAARPREIHDPRPAKSTAPAASAAKPPAQPKPHADDPLSF